MSNRLSTPRTKIPKLLRDAPLASLAASLLSLQLPRFTNFGPTPGAIPHKRHQSTFAALARATTRITFVWIHPCCFFDKLGSVAPRTIVPVILDATFTAGTARCHRGI